MMVKIMSDFSYRLSSILNKQNSSTLISNLNAHIESYTLDDELIPTSVVDTIVPNCYIASPYAMMITYAKDELIKVDSSLYRGIASLLIRSFASILRLAHIDRVQTLNNYLLSTNFFSQYWEKTNNFSTLKEMAIERHPEHAILIRSINRIQNPYLFNTLKNEGWTPLVSRQVYLFSDWNRIQKKDNFRFDQKLLFCDRFVFVKPELDDYDAFLEAQRLYNCLYLDKYSIHNVQFTSLYLKKLVEQRLLHLRLLKDTLHQRYVGVVGMIGENGVITAPIVGYDTTYPQSDALYRRIIAYSLSYAHQYSYLLNLSSGAPQFKTLRGAESHLEYMFVYTHHLSFRQRAVWRILSLISNYFYAPLLQRFKL